MKDSDTISITIQHQGAVRVNFGYEYCRNQDTVLLEIDLHTKYAEISAYSETETEAPEIYLHAGEEAIHTLAENTDETVFSLDNYSGYDVFTASICKYSLRVSLVRKQVLQDLINRDSK